MTEGFFHRWARRKLDDRQSGGHGEDDVPSARAEARVPHVQGDAVDVDLDVDLPAAAAPQSPDSPTLQDLARLPPDADLTAFFAPAVDRGVRRAALKKLLADPHFNRTDGLDIYMGDYTLPSPLTPEMRSALQHARHLFADPGEEADRGNAGGATSVATSPGDRESNEASAVQVATEPTMNPFDASPVARDDLSGFGRFPASITRPKS